LKRLLLLVFLTGCVPAGSPRINITKNVYVVDSCDVEVSYSTKSSTDSDADITQELRELLKVPAPTPGG